MVARPVEQVLDEVEQAGVRPLHILERQDDRRRVRQPLEEQPPGGEQILPVAGRRVLEPEQVGQARLDEGPLLRIEQMLGQRRRQLLARRARLLVLGDPAAHPDHVGERPVGDTLPVGQTAAPVPPDLLDDPVEVLVELPDQSRLADPGDPRHRDQLRPAVLGAVVEEVLDPFQLAVAPDERRLEPGRAKRAAATGNDPQRPPQRYRLRLALQLLFAGALVDNRLLGRAARCLADQDAPRLGCRLDPRSRVHEIACHHALARGADRHRRLPCQHARPRLQRRIQLGNRGDQIERRPHRPLAVTLGRHRRPPDRHHRITDELLHRPAVPGDQRPRQLEIA